VTLARSGTDLAVSVIDDGCGFDLEAVRRDGRGLGLVSVEERARLVGGDVHIVTAPGQGTTILARVPAGESPAAYQRAPAEKTFATRLRTSETHT
jgi:signal transduction histidine kinase